ncbi:hypothetical protein XELAEV_18030257mg [Xenopus laevis]|uniref:Uncharacterized protein n=1 Tax=Xenopus laevis TaxID=8355 RepID=A0A974HIL4_XENLA|nr:hypothetical protein XELAEV_18030257mg [Xenopus laevis]
MAFSSPDSQSPREREMLDTGRRYMWTGLFGQKMTSHGDVRLLPLCGGCGAETQYCNLNVDRRCHRCQRQFYIGPLFTTISDPQEWQQLDLRLYRWESRYSSTVAESTQTPTATVADQRPTAIVAPPIAGPKEPVTDVRRKLLDVAWRSPVREYRALSRVQKKMNLEKSTHQSHKGNPVRRRLKQTGYWWKGAWQQEASRPPLCRCAAGSSNWRKGWTSWKKQKKLNTWPNTNIFN